MKAPYFWSAGLDPSSRDAAPVTRKILTPLAWLYAQLTARRLRKTKPVKVDAVVICVGNLTAGGTGKSPIVQYVRDAMTEQTGLRVATLSRGYGGTLKGPLRVDPDRHFAAEVGDEPLMLAQKGESWIGRDRALAGHVMAADGIDLIVMDDGHQNPSLHKDLSIIVIDTEAGFGNGHVIPKGPLREPGPIGLSRADLVIAMGNQTLPDSVQASGKPVYKAQLTPTALAPAGKLVAFAGIGRPEKFFDSLRALDCDLVDAVPFDDHHPYRKDDLAYLNSLATDHSAKLITTEKDFARLTAIQRRDILTLPISVEFEDRGGLMQVLRTAVERAKRHG